MAAALIAVLFACSTDNPNSMGAGKPPSGGPGMSGPGAAAGPSNGSSPGGPEGPNEMPPEIRIPDEAEDYEGTFVLLGGMTPTLTLEDGAVYYLIFRFPISNDGMPEDGTVLHVKAVPETDHPDRLEVYSADIDGVPLRPEMPERSGPPGGGGSAPPRPKG